MKVLLIGEIFSENLGDQLVYFATKMLLQEKYPNMDFTELDIMGRTAYPNKFKNNDTLNIERSSEFNSRIKNIIQSQQFGDFAIKYRRAKKNVPYYDGIISKGYDIAIFVGGQVISDTFGTYLYEIVKLLERNNIPIIFHAVGLGIINNRLQKEKYINIFKKNNIAGISCRCNPERFNNLLLEDNNRKAIFTFDSGIFASELYNISRDNNTSYVGLGIMMSKRYKIDTIIQFWTTVIEKLNERKIKWKAFTTGQTSDYLLAKEILIRMGYTESQIFKLLVEKPQIPSELVNTIAGFDRILSFRLHSHIIAYSLNVPSIAIEWDNKIKDFMIATNNSDSYFTIEADIDKILQSLLNKPRAFDYERNVLANKQLLKKTLYKLVDNVGSKDIDEF